MSETKHTPGPWRVSERTATSVLAEHPQWSDYSVCSTGGSVAPDIKDLRETQEADARLIAAAPAMLEALEDCADVLALCREEFGEPDGLPCLLDRIESARQAIAAARGEVQS